MLPPLLDATGLTQAFDYRLFDTVDLSVMAGESVAIVGRSGSGKSTLLHILSTFLPPDAGRVTLLGEDLYRLPLEQIEALRRYDVGIIFQFHYLFKGMRAMENIRVATMLSGSVIDPKLLERLEIAHLMEHKTSELSGGEQQRVSIARVLSKSPRIIFADEPTGNLDKETATLVMDVLLAYTQEHQAGLVLVTHDMQMAQRCDQTYRLSDKKLILEGV